MAMTATEMGVNADRNARMAATKMGVTAVAMVDA